MNRSQQLAQMGINDLKQAVLDVLSNEETIRNRFLKSDEIGDLLNIPKSPNPSLRHPIALGILEQLKKDGYVSSFQEAPRHARGWCITDAGRKYVEPT